MHNYKFARSITFNFTKIINTSSVIRQKGESQNGGNKTKHTKFSEKRTFLTL